MHRPGHAFAIKTAVALFLSLLPIVVVQYFLAVAPTVAPERFASSAVDLERSDRWRAALNLLRSAVDCNGS